MQQETQFLQKKSPNNRVRVAIRIRPLVQRQIVNGDTSCIQVVSDTQIILANEKLFKFDKVLQQTSQQQQVYDSCVRSLVSKCFQGYNAAILAYGQTGSGKTFTMGTSSSKKITQQDRGILPRVIQNIFQQVQKNSSQFKYTIKATFLQIYNQHIIDLLSDQHSSKSLKQNTIAIREEKDGSVSIYGANQEEVFGQDDMLELLDRGSFHRTTASTLMNDASSRSHAIFTINIERNSLNPIEIGIDENYVTAKFVFVDLAGSERIKKTGATGNTLKQGININLGLLELGNVISSLAIEKKQAKYINYRNSKLTRILQDSLGGNSNTYMIACVSPAESNYQQSLNSIKYASKAMNIKNKPVINRDPQQAHILKLKGIITSLQKQNNQLKKILNQKGINLTISSKYNNNTQIQSEQVSRIKTKISILQKKCQNLIIQNKQDKKKMNQLQIQLYDTRRDKDLLGIKIERLLKGQSLSQDNNYTPIIQTYLNKIQYLETQIHQKQKSISQLQIQYSKLYDATERDSIILVKKNDKIFNLEKNIRTLERKIQQIDSKYKNTQKNQEYQNSNSNFIQNYNINDPLDRISLKIQQLQQQSCIDQLQSQVNLQNDSQFRSQISHHTNSQMKLDSQIKQVQKIIHDRQISYAQITQQQINLQYKLIKQMKQQYHQKINQLQKQKQKLLLNNKKNHINQNQFENNKNVNKIDNLEMEIRQFKKKIKQQKNLEKQVNTQSTKLKQLAQEINNFKMQKIQLNRKNKQEKEKFNKFKTKRVKQLFNVKKQNNKKDHQIRRLKNQNKKYAQQAIKKKQQLKRAKKVNQTLKILMKPKKLMRGSNGVMQVQQPRPRTNSIATFTYPNTKRQPQQNNPTQIDFDQIISQSIKSILYQIDRQIQASKISIKCNQIDKEIQTLKEEQSVLNIKIQRLQLKNQQKDIFGEQIMTYKDIQKSQQQRVLLNQCQIKLQQVHQRLINLQQDLEFKLTRYQDLITPVSDPRYNFNYQTQIIYNKKYQNIQSFRSLLVSIYHSLIKLLTENINLKQQSQNLLFEKNSLIYEISNLKDQLFNMGTEYQQNLSKLREEIMEKYYQQLQIRENSQIENISFNNETKMFNVNHTLQKRQEEELKKKYQKKIEEVNKMNKALVKQLQVQRKKCQIVTEKYNNLKILLNKDKFIGITLKDDQLGFNNNSNNFNTNFNNNNFNNNNSNFNNFHSTQYNSLTNPNQYNNNNYQNNTNSTNSTNLNQQIQLKSNQRQKQRQSINNYNFNQKRKLPETIKQIYQNVQRKSAILTDIQFNKNTWQLAAQIPDAHKSSILAMTSHENILVSTSSKAFALWDLQSNQLIHQVTGGVNSTFIKSAIIHPERKIMFTTNDRNINVWDLRTFKSEMVLKGHKDEIRLLHIHEDTLFSAGKGTVNGGSLLIWDLKGSMSFTAVCEKQKNQDIFSMTSEDGILYYGTRDHFVRRMKIQNNQTLLAFQPPHMDTVTGLAAFGQYIISGSKDKNLRLWSLQSSMCNLKSTIHSFNQYITSLQSDDYLPLFYVSDKSGQVKIGTVRNEKIQFVGGILAHSQQINSICKLNSSPHRGIFATGSTDKCIKIWRPSNQTLNHVLNDY